MLIPRVGPRDPATLALYAGLGPRGRDHLREQYLTQLVPANPKRARAPVGHSNRLTMAIRRKVAGHAPRLTVDHQQASGDKGGQQVARPCSAGPAGVHRGERRGRGRGPGVRQYLMQHG